MPRFVVKCEKCGEIFEHWTVKMDSHDRKRFCDYCLVKRRNAYSRKVNREKYRRTQEANGNKVKIRAKDG